MQHDGRGRCAELGADGQKLPQSRFQFLRALFQFFRRGTLFQNYAVQAMERGGVLFIRG
jgi:hypothetical protein